MADSKISGESGNTRNFAEAKPGDDAQAARQTQREEAEALEERRRKEAILAQTGTAPLDVKAGASVEGDKRSVDVEAGASDDMKKKAASATDAALESAAAGGLSASTRGADTAATGAAATAKAADRTVDDERDVDEESEEKALSVNRKGAELEKGEFIVPRHITQTYTEHEGKFYAKDSNRMMFHDQGSKLATSTTDKTAIADMVAYAKAKQWESLKLTGSQEFRREAWLQAESQGIKTKGYTPRESDLAALKTLSMERATNSMTPLQNRTKDSAEVEKPVSAPRHDLNKNQAATASAVAQNNTAHIKELQKDPAKERFTVEELSKIAFYRGLIEEREKYSPPDVREEAIAKFDAAMNDPTMVKALPDPEIKAEEQAADKAREHDRDTSELSL